MYIYKYKLLYYQAFIQRVIKDIVEEPVPSSPANQLGINFMSFKKLAAI